jgi:3-methylfumaryl-CoA hydratase
VTVTHTYTQPFDAADLALREEQDIVYRPVGPDAPAAQTTDREVPQVVGSPGPDAELAFDLPITPTLLFRFSALTYNAHRIHYDRPYAMEQENYPGLVVHGPLQAIALAELARRDTQRLSSFQFRALRPVYDEGDVRLRGRLADGGRLLLTAYDTFGRTTMQADALLSAPRDGAG